jgi:hypothetical protein
MNRELLLEASIGLTVGLLVVVLVAFRTGRRPRPGVTRRAAMMGLLTYAIIAVPVMTVSGMTALGMIALVVIVAFALAGSLLSRRFAPVSDGPAHGYVQALVGSGVAAILLIAAAQTLSLISRVDPRVLVLVLGVVVAVLVAGQGLAASGRIGSVAMWLMIVPIVISLALGFLLGDVSAVVSPIRIGAETPFAAILGVAVAIFALGWVDGGLQATSRAGRWSPVRVLLWVAVVIVAILLGLLSFLGGIIFAPSMEFFVVPANIDALPGLAGVLLAVLTVIFAALVAGVLAGVGSLAGGVGAREGDEESVRPAASGGEEAEVPIASAWVWTSAAVAIIVALFDPGSQQLVVVAGLLAAGLIGAQVSRARSSVGVLAGVLSTIVATVVLAVLGQLRLGWGSILATLVVCLVAFLAGRLTGSRDLSESLASAAPG